MTVMDRYIECLTYVRFFIFVGKPRVAQALSVMLDEWVFVRLEMRSSDVSRVEEFILLNL